MTTISFSKENISLMNKRNKMEAIKLLNLIDNETIRVSFFDPQYRGILDKMNYGNEETGKGNRRASLEQMPEEIIKSIIIEINLKLKKSGYLFLWVDKFHLCQGIHEWILNTDLQIVDLITWDKDVFGLGYRTRRQSEYIIVLQKIPILAKKTWFIHNIPDVWKEKVPRGKKAEHPHMKPIELQKQLIKATTIKGDIVLDPCSGSFSVMKACKEINIDFIGGDLNG